MKIKQFLLLSFLILFTVATYVNYSCLKIIAVEKNTIPIKNYVITKIDCSFYSGAAKSKSIIKILYNKNEYQVEVSRSLCKSLKVGGTVNEKLYYLNDRDQVYIEGYMTGYKLIYAAYIFSVILPLIGFIVYRKELNNNYKTM